MGKLEIPTRQWFDSHLSFNNIIPPPGGALFQNFADTPLCDILLERPVTNYTCYASLALLLLTFIPQVDTFLNSTDNPHVRYCQKNMWSLTHGMNLPQALLKILLRFLMWHIFGNACDYLLMLQTSGVLLPLCHFLHPSYFSRDPSC